MCWSILLLSALLACGGVPVDGASPPRAMNAVAAPNGDERPGDEVVARWNGGQLTWSDLENQVGADLRAMDVEHQLRRYELQSQALDSMIDRTILAAEAEQQGLDGIEALLQQEVESKVDEPSEAAVVEAFTRVQSQVPGAALDSARPYIVQELQQRQMADLYQVYIRDLRSRVKLEHDIPYPDLPRVEVPVLAEDPAYGSDKATVTVVQFAEYQCFYCNRVLPTLDRLLEEYDGKLRLVFKDFPLQNHGRAIPAAVAAHCAGEQSEYWAYSRVLLANQAALSDDDLQHYARELDLDEKRFIECTASGRHVQTVEDGVALGNRLGVQATPTFFVNGLMVSGAQPYERFKALVERELERLPAEQ